MCGIGGCFATFGSEPDRLRLEQMGAALAHRGPDGEGVDIDGPVGLVHRRLSIVDPGPAGQQPMTGPDGWRVTYNGEIFNHMDLRRELQGPYRGGTDTETLLHALARWGLGAVERCNGLFAFAAVEPGARRAFLVRDRFGIKPLYYAEHEGCLWFASEIRALVAAGVPARFDASLLRDNLETGWLGGPQTLFRGIQRLLPGTMIEVGLRTGARRATRWYDPAEVVDAERSAARSACSRAQLQDSLEAALRISVKRRLMADVPLGTMCSGGLDSSLITALAREEHPRIHAFNAAVTDQPEVDEGPWAERVASALGVELHTARMSAEDWRGGLVAATLHNEHPLVHESSIPMAMIAELARSRGVKVLLSGEGADELFGGYEWLHQAEYRDFSSRARRLESTARTGRRRQQRLSSLLVARGRASPEAGYRRGVERRAQRAYRFHRGARRRLEAALLADLGTYLPHLLNRQDKNTMQHSIETRVPFLDPDVVALAVNLPLEARVEPSRKALVREVGLRHLPRAVVERPKVGFGFDIDRCMSGRLNPAFLEQGILRETLGASPQTWREGVRRLTGQGLMLHVTAEILGRSLQGGAGPEAIASDLWQGA